MRRLYKKLMSSVLLLVFLLNLLPTAALAAGTCTKTEGCQLAKDHDDFCENGNTFTVYDYGQFISAITRVNSGATGEYIISLGDDITDLYGSSNTDLSFTENTTTILGNGHKITFKNVSLGVSGDTVLNLGASGYEKTLQLESEDTTKCIMGLSGHATLNMYDHVTIGPSSAGGQAGGVQLAGNSQFNMYGGTITECINWASVAGGVLADDSSTFHMYDGTISNCSGYQGGGVGVMNSANFIMDDGTISGCEDKWLGGGGVNIFGNGASFTMNGGTITNCTGTSTEYGYGGGLFVYDGAVTVSENVKIYNNHASDAGDDIYNNTGATLTLKADPSGLTLDACSHVIDGWYIDGCKDAASTSRWSISPCSSVNADYAEKYTVPDTAITAEIALKAAHGSGHTVTFDTQGGSLVGNQTVSPGTAATEPAAPTRDGYEFDGWYKDRLCTKAYDFSTPVTGDITLYAKWVSASPHYVLKYGDRRPDDGGEEYTFPYDPANPVDLPTEVKYFSQEEIGQLPPESIYGHTNTEGTYFLAWFGYMPALGSAINTNYPVYEKTGENTYTEFSGTSDAGTTYYQFIPCETTPDKNLGDITYYAQWVKVKIDITVDIQVDVDVSFDENLGGNVVMIDDSQKQELAKNFKPGDIVSNNCEITLTATVANPKDADEQEKTAEYLTQNDPDCRFISYDVEIKKDIKSNGAPYSSTVLKELEAPIEIIFVIPQEWQNGTVKMLRAHTDEYGVVTVSECADLDNDRNTFTVSSDKFSTYTMLYIPAGGGVGIETACTLRYQSNGGTAYPNETKIGPWVKNYASLPVPVREGCTFTGWYADSTLQTPITGDVQVSRNLVTIYAGWEKGTVPGMLNGENHYAYVQGYTDGTVRPNDNITRAEAATLFFRLLKDEIRDENLSDTNTFADVTEEMWCNKAISTMALLGIVKGRTAACFDPNAPITRAEFAAICARFDQSDVIGRSTFTDIDNHWAKEEIERAAALGWVWSNTNGTFRPQDYITRAEAMTMINRMLQRVPESAEDLLPDMITWPDNKPNDWYYLAVQEATNSHDFTRKISGYETWTALTRNRDRSVY